MDRVVGDDVADLILLCTYLPSKISFRDERKNECFQKEEQQMEDVVVVWKREVSAWLAPRTTKEPTTEQLCGGPPSHTPAVCFYNIKADTFLSLTVMG